MKEKLRLHSHSDLVFFLVAPSIYLPAEVFVKIPTLKCFCIKFGILLPVSGTQLSVTAVFTTEIKTCKKVQKLLLLEVEIKFHIVHKSILYFLVTNLKQLVK